MSQPKTLDAEGRCCGRKPLVYKRPEHRLFCCRCDAEFDPVTGIQQENWAWRREGTEFIDRRTPALARG